MTLLRWEGLPASTSLRMFKVQCFLFRVCIVTMVCAKSKPKRSHLHEILDQTVIIRIHSWLMWPPIHDLTDIT